MEERPLCRKAFADLGVGDGEALYELLYKLPPGEHRLKNKRARLMSAAVMPIVDAVGTPDDLSNDRQVSRMIARRGPYGSQTVFVKAEKLQKQVNAFARHAKKRSRDHEAKSGD